MSTISIQATDGCHRAGIVPAANRLSEIVETGDWATDNASGRATAYLYVDALRETGDIMPLVRLMQNMATSGRDGGVETGFATAVALALR